MCKECEHKYKTTVYYDDDVVWVEECVVCKDPLVLLKRHGLVLSRLEIEHIQSIVKRWPNRKIDKKRHERSRHYQIHLRSNHANSSKKQTSIPT